jgi:hypothetical protein
MEMSWKLRNPDAFIAAATEFSSARNRHRDTARDLGAKASTLAAAVAAEAAAADMTFPSRAAFTAFYLALVFSVPVLERAYDDVELRGFRILMAPAASRQGKKASREDFAAASVARNRVGYLWQLLQKCHAAVCTAPTAAVEPELRDGDAWELSQLIVARGSGEGEEGEGGGGAALAAAEAGESSGGADSEKELSEDESAASGVEGGGGGDSSGGSGDEEAEGTSTSDEDSENRDILVLPTAAKRALSPPASPAAPLQQPPLAKRGGSGGGGGGAVAAAAAVLGARRFPPNFRHATAAGDGSRSPSSSGSSTSGSSSPSSAHSLRARPPAARAAALAYAAAREQQLDAAAAAAVDQPLVDKMAAAGAPVSVAVRALALAREAVKTLDPGGGALYVKGLKCSIRGLAEQLVEARDRVVHLEKQCKMWRDAAMGGEGALEG